jgi:hypothetical protein
VGEARVAIQMEPVKVAPPPTKDKDAKPPKDGAGRSIGLPKKYADPETSGLLLRVQSGRQQYDIQLD